jgi:hypothetical protein
MVMGPESENDCHGESQQQTTGLHWISQLVNIDRWMDGRMDGYVER